MGTTLENSTQQGDLSMIIQEPVFKDQTIGESIQLIQTKIHMLLSGPTVQEQIRQHADKAYYLPMKPEDIVSKATELEEEIARAFHYLANPVLSDEETSDIPIVQAYDFTGDYGLASVIDVLAQSAGLSERPNRVLSTQNQRLQPILQTKYYALRDISPINAHNDNWQLYLAETKYTGAYRQRIIIDEDTTLQMSKDSPPFHSLILS